MTEVSKKLAKFKVNNTRKAIYYYLMITKPLHKLTNVKVKLLTEILYMYYKEKPNFVRDDDAWAKVFSRAGRADIRDELGMGKQVFENYMTEYRKENVIINNQVNPSFNPMITDDCNVYEVTFRFEIVDG